MECSAKGPFRWYSQSIQLAFILCVILLAVSSISCILDSEDAPVNPKGAIFGTEDGGVHWWRHVTEADALNGIADATLNKWVAVGSKGMILRSTDGGEIWLPVSSGTTENLYDVANNYVVQSLIAVGSDGRIIRSTDGGQTWQPVPSATIRDLYAVKSVINTSLAVGAFGAIIRSTDGGGSWSEVISPTTSTLNDVAISAEPGVAYVVGSVGTFLRSSDDGVTWNSITIPDVTNADNLTGVLTPSPNQIFITGIRTDGGSGINKGIIVQSLDGGTTWTVITKPSNIVDEFDPIHAISNGGGFLVMAVGKKGSTYVLDSDGVSWLFTSRASAEHLESVLPYGGNLGFAVGTAD
jgi:photosystem II stability/assembly factor-like uncharacterized protein